MNLSVGNIERKIAEYRRIRMSDTMQPDLFDASVETMVELVDHGTTYYCPVSVLEHWPFEVVKHHYSGYFIRWSAPGYWDQSEWSGPYDTKYDAYYDLWLQFDSDTIPLHQWLRKYGIEIELEEKRQ